MALCLAACGESPGSPIYGAANGYLSALANGNYSNACRWLDGRARRSLVHSTGARVSCQKAFVLCLPNQALVAKKDQSQLFYATVDMTVDGSKASAKVSGTPVADVLKRIALAGPSKGPWKVTSYGDGLKGCRERNRHRGHA
jgi:hypothetical protein